MHDMSNTRKEIAARLGFAAGNGAKVSFERYEIGDAFKFEDKIYVINSHPNEINAVLSSADSNAKKALSLADFAHAKWLQFEGKAKSTRPGAKGAFAKWEVTPTKKNGVPIEEHTAKIGIDLWKIDTMPHAGVGVGSLYRWDKLRGLRLVSTGQVDLLKKQAEAISTKKDAISDLMRGFSRSGTKTTMTREQTEEQKAGLKIMSAADPAVGAKIAKLIKEGKPQDQAVAIALDMKRRGEL